MKTILTEKASRITYLDILRISAAFFIVMIHVAAENWSLLPIESFSWNMVNLYDGTARFGVPIFVMISGALFLDKDYSYQKILKTHVLKIAICYLLWSAIYAVVPYIRHREMLNPAAVLTRMFNGHSHLWFLIMLIGLYLIVPFLRRIAVKKDLAKIFVILSFLFAFFVPQLISVVGLFSKDASRLMSDFSKVLNLHFVLGYSGYFMLGYLLSKATLKKGTKIVLIIAGICGAGITIGGTLGLSLSMGKPQTMLYDYLSVNVLLTAVAVFIAAKELFARKPNSKVGMRRLAYLSKCSFGVYLIHPLLIVILVTGLKIDLLGFSPILSIPLYSIAIFIMSYLISMLLNKIPFVNKWVV